jgi:hypothetical protein
VLVVAVALAGGVSTVQAQAGVQLTGSVADSASGVQIPNAIIILDSATVARSDSFGDFELSDVSAGRHAISVSAVGYAPTVYVISVPANGGGVVDIGAFLLPAVEPPIGRIAGVVRDTITGHPVAGADLYLNGVRLIRTDVEGRFAVDGVAFGWGTNLLAVRRLLYAPVLATVRVLEPAPHIEIEIGMTPLPTALPEVVVEEERTTFHYGALAGFHRRRRAGLGTFVTEEEVASRRAGVLTDVLRWVPDVEVVPRGPSEYTVVPRTRQFGCNRMELFVDGQRLTAMPIDQLVRPEQVAGIEIYTRASVMPAEFNVSRDESACGAIVIWTK